MNYIYDIVLNFNENAYNFYDWYKEDNIELYIKVPVFKIEEDILKKISTSIFTVDKEFLSIIYNKTIKYLAKKSKSIKYVALFVSENICLAVEFDDSGKSVKRSFLGIDEEVEILDYAKTLKYRIINYKILKTNGIKHNYLTRKEIYDKNNMIKTIKEIYNNKEEDKLNYIFYEVYNEKNDNLEKEYLKLINLVENDSNKISKLLNVLLSLKKIKTC